MVVATGNAHKLREIAAIFPEYRILSQREAGFTGEAEETGGTFTENALIKAETACKALALPVLADDSGICVDALGGAPGIYSARYAGTHGDDKANRALLLQNLEKMRDDGSRRAPCRPARLWKEKQWIRPIATTRPIRARWSGATATTR